MNRSVRFVLVALIFFLLFYFLINTFLISPKKEVASTPAPIVEPTIDVYVLDEAVKKKQALNKSVLSVKTLKLSELKGIPNSPVSDFSLTSGTLFTRDVPAGSYLSVEDIVNPQDEDYLFMALNEGELPYWYDITALISNEAFVVKSGDYVSFALVKPNLSSLNKRRTLEMTSDIVVSQVRVLKLSKTVSLTGSQRSGPTKYHLVLALSLKDILALEKVMQSKEQHLKLLLTTNIKKRDESIVEVYNLKREVKKGQYVDVKDFAIQIVNKANLGSGYIERDSFQILPGSVYKGSYSEGMVLSDNMIATTFDKDYPLQFLKESEVPYWVDVTDVVDQGAFVAKTGDLVDFILRIVASNGPGNLNLVSSKVIEKQVRVLHMSSHHSIDKGIKHHLVVALNPSQVLKLETAEKTGDLSVVLSSTNGGESKDKFNSRMFVDRPRQGVKMLRGGQ